MMNLSKITFSVCHSFRSTSQFGRIKGFKRCLQVFHQCCWRQQLNVRLFCEESSPVWGLLSPFWGNLSPLWGFLSPFWGELSPFFGIIKPVKGLNTKPNLGNVFRIARKSAATELKTPLIGDTSGKKVILEKFIIKVKKANAHSPNSLRIR